MRGRQSREGDVRGRHAEGKGQRSQRQRRAEAEEWGGKGRGIASPAVRLQYSPAPPPHHQHRQHPAVRASVSTDAREYTTNNTLEVILESHHGKQRRKKENKNGE